MVTSTTSVTHPRESRETVVGTVSVLWVWGGVGWGVGGGYFYLVLVSTSNLM